MVSVGRDCWGSSHEFSLLIFGTLSLLLSLLDEDLVFLFYVLGKVLLNHLKKLIGVDLEDDLIPCLKPLSKETPLKEFNVK
jgi:hypothetical protein